MYLSFSSGEGSIKYLYTRYVFQWDISQYGLYSTYMFIINITGTEDIIRETWLLLVIITIVHEIMLIILSELIL